MARMDRATRRNLEVDWPSSRVYLDLGYWKDFLENGHLHRHSESSTGFEFAQLSPPQMHRLLAFLETQNEFKPEYYPLLVGCGSDLA